MYMTHEPHNIMALVIWVYWHQVTHVSYNMQFNQYGAMFLRTNMNLNINIIAKVL